MSPTVQFRLKWEVDTFVMWDNRSSQHAVAADFYPNERVVERVTIIGDRTIRCFELAFDVTWRFYIHEIPKVRDLAGTSLSIVIG